MCSGCVGHNRSFCYDVPNYSICIQQQTAKRKLIDNAVVGVVVFIPQSLILFGVEHFSRHLFKSLAVSLTICGVCFICKITKDILNTYTYIAQIQA